MTNEGKIPAMVPLSPKVQKYVSLSIGILAYLIGGIVLGFNVYALAMKRTFNYTQTQLDNIASSGDMGLPLTFPAGIVVDKFGPRVACSVSLILTTTGFALTWMAAENRLFFSSHSWLLCVFYFLASVGTRFIIIATKVICCKNFDRKHIGKIVGLFGALFGISPAAFSVIYNAFFVQGHTEDPENQKFGEFMLLLALLAACVNSYGVVMLRTVPDEAKSEEIELGPLNSPGKNLNKLACQKPSDDQVSEKTSLIPKENDNKTTMKTEPNLNETVTSTPPCAELNWCQMIKTKQFYYVFIICIIIAGNGGTITNNITIIVKSASIDPNLIPLTVVIPISASFGQFIGGALPDVIFEKWPDCPKSSFLFFPVGISLISQIILVFFNTNIIGLTSSSVMLAFGYGALYPPVNLLVVDYYGLNHFGQNFGLMAISHGIGIVIFQQIFAWNYENYSPVGETECYGESCSMWYFVLMTILTAVVSFLIICLIIIERDEKHEHAADNS